MPINVPPNLLPKCNVGVNCSNKKTDISGQNSLNDIRRNSKPGQVVYLTPSVTPTITPTITITPSITPTITITPSITPTITATMTLTPTSSPVTPPLAFESIWKTTTPFETVTLPYVIGGLYQGRIDWGDGNSETNSSLNKYHTYQTPGEYRISISGTVTGFAFNNGGDKNKIIEILQWGQLRGLNNDFSNMFTGCINLILTGVTDLPNLYGVTSLNQMFRGCTKITTINRIDEWQISRVNNMNGLFQSCSFFNGNIGGWDVAPVNNMSFMFDGALQFNQNIGNWNVSNVTNMTSMFRTATNFNNNNNNSIKDWNTSAATQMGNMFNGASSFNQDLNKWCVKNIGTQPQGFDTNATSWTGGSATRPQWGNNC